jgi:hypothetical protein
LEEREREKERDPKYGEEREKKCVGEPFFRCEKKKEKEYFALLYDRRET